MCGADPNCVSGIGLRNAAKQPVEADYLLGGFRFTTGSGLWCRSADAAARAWEQSTEPIKPGRICGYASVSSLINSLLLAHRNILSTQLQLLYLVRTVDRY